MRADKAAAWRTLVAVLLSIYLPRWHMVRVRRRVERLAVSDTEGT